MVPLLRDEDRTMGGRPKEGDRGRSTETDDKRRHGLQ